MDKQKMDFEYDVSDEVWDVYKKVYNKEKWSFWRKVDLQHPTYKKNRRYAYIDTTTNDYIEFNEHKTFAMSGETDFNFHKNGNGQAQYNIYIKYLKRDFKDQELIKYIHALNKCKNNHHSIQNCSLMPCKGNLQGIKGSIGKDRLDTFVYVLSLYYSEEKVEIVLNKSTYENCESLRLYLNQFIDIYDYCEKVYFISRSLTYKLLENGKKAITSGKDVVTYIELANQFWQEKAEYYKNRDVNIEVTDIYDEGDIK